MLPALIALALHNGALLAFLLSKELDNIDSTDHETRGVNGWCYFWLPRVFGPFLSLLLYRTEHILRESAIVGIIGITTLGFYIDSGFEDLHFDTAFLFIMITALLTLLTDSLSRRAQRYIGN
jgi:phosphonate transport system permease protein